MFIICILTTCLRLPSLPLMFILVSRARFVLCIFTTCLRLPSLLFMLMLIVCVFVSCCVFHDLSMSAFNAIFRHPCGVLNDYVHVLICFCVCLYSLLYSTPPHRAHTTPRNNILHHANTYEYHTHVGLRKENVSHCGKAESWLSPLFRCPDSIFWLNYAETPVKLYLNSGEFW